MILQKVMDILITKWCHSSHFRLGNNLICHSESEPNNRWACKRGQGQPRRIRSLMDCGRSVPSYPSYRMNFNARSFIHVHVQSRRSFAAPKMPTEAYHPCPYPRVVFDQQWSLSADVLKDFRDAKGRDYASAGGHFAWLILKSG